MKAGRRGSTGLWVASAAVVLLRVGTLCASGVPTSDLEPYEVRVLRGLPEEVGHLPMTGYAGIYLGRGRVLTASHVAGSPLTPKPLFIVVGVQPLAARFVKAGRFEQVDVTLLSVDETSLPAAMRKLAPLAFCTAPPVPGEAVTVIGDGKSVPSVIVSPDVLPPGVPPEFNTLIRDVYTTPNSGSAVFDAGSGCLMGIMSRKIERVSGRPDGPGGVTKEGVAKYFVPASQIRAFLGDSL